MQLQKVIERLGYTPNEAKVYLATLNLGEAHISDIAVKVKLPRTTTQAIIDKLHKDNLVNFYVQRRYKYWVAENPERLLVNLKKREDAMREALPILAAVRKSHWGKPRKKANEEHDLGFFRILADGLSQPLLITNELVEIEHVNPAWEEQFGYVLEEVRGKNPRILQSGKTPREVYTRMQESLKAGKLFQSDKIIDQRKDGTQFNLLTTIFPVRHGGRLYYIQILDDNTARMRAQSLHQRFVRSISN